MVLSLGESNERKSVGCELSSLPSEPCRSRQAAAPHYPVTIFDSVVLWSVSSCVEDYTMATNLAIDPQLLDKALEVGGEKTKKATVNSALREFIARREQKRLLELFGKLDWDDEYDYKRERTRR